MFEGGFYFVEPSFYRADGDGVLYNCTINEIILLKDILSCNLLSNIGKLI
jgi:hypothetical protein